MLIRQTRPSDVKPSEITPKSVYLNRRSFMKTAAVAGAGAAFLPLMPRPLAAAPLEGFAKTDWGKGEEPTSFMSATSYNNFYEFGTGKGDPIKNSRDFTPKPWSVKIDGLCGKPGEIGFEDLMAPHALEERVYRHRCVEAWSMVIPWIGVPLGDVLKRFEPLDGAKFVAFETLLDPERMPNQKNEYVLHWPYAEGLRIDEAMHPLTLLTTGMYGQELPNQNGAPLRLVVPWKYGFKGIKSIVRISFVAEQPRATWNEQQPEEYGFYSNVNPARDHPRWSQKRERRIGEFLKRDTLPFNGYADEVAGLYAGMDLINKYF